MEYWIAASNILKDLPVVQRPILEIYTLVWNYLIEVKKFVNLFTVISAYLQWYARNFFSWKIFVKICKKVLLKASKCPIIFKFSFNMFGCSMFLRRSKFPMSLKYLCYGLRQQPRSEAGRGPKGKEVGRGVRPRFGSSGAWLQLIGCALHYVRPRDFEVKTRGES
jgi:hypothetical protein